MGLAAESARGASVVDGVLEYDFWHCEGEEGARAVNGSVVVLWCYCDIEIDY